MTGSQFNLIALILAVIVTTSADPSTKMKCHNALRAFRKLKRLAAKP